MNAVKKKLPIIKGLPVLLSGNKFKHLGDFIYHDGPIMSHLLGQNNEDYLMLWFGSDSTHNRWLLYKTNLELLHRFFKGEMGDRDLILKNPDGFAYLVDINRKIEWDKTLLIKNNEIPEMYLPQSEAVYSNGPFTEYVLQLKSFIELHFNRQIKSYPIIENKISILHEPASPEYKTKK